MLALFLVICLVSIIYQSISDLVVECKARSQKTMEARPREGGGSVPLQEVEEEEAAGAKGASSQGETEAP
jgi:hypothetical protein